MPPDQNQANSEAAPETGSTERAFARGSGLVFQTVGVAVLLASIGVLWVCGLLHKSTSETPTRWLDHFQGETLPAAILAIGAWSGIVGGLALATAGLGLQAERTDAARFGVIAAVFLVAIYWAATAVWLTQTGHWFFALPAALVGLGMMFLAGLARRSLLVLRRFPPPPDRNIVTDEVLEQWRAEREKRREKHT